MYISTPNQTDWTTWFVWFGLGVTSSNKKFHLFHLCRGFKLVSFKVIFLVKDCPDLFQLLLDLFKVLEMLTAMAKVQFMAKAKVKSSQGDPVNRVDSTHTRIGLYDDIGPRDPDFDLYKSFIWR